MSGIKKALEGIYLFISVIGIVGFAVVLYSYFAQQTGDATGDFLFIFILIALPWLFVSLFTPFLVLRDWHIIRNARTQSLQISRWLIIRDCVYVLSGLMAYGVLATAAYFILFGHFS